VQDIKAQLRKLNPAQLNELRKYIDGLLLLPGGRVTVEGKASWILQVLEMECQGLAIGRLITSERARRAVNKASEELTDFFERACPGSPLVHKRLVLAVGIRLLYERMVAQGLAVNPALLATQLMTVPAVLDREYPGYARLGILGKVVNAGEQPARVAEAAASPIRKRSHAPVPKPRARQARKPNRPA
jgi:hypothetical protein